ncbi:hypothetical protein NC653_024343 [Populus alba x Populus x berolinensis]|uniref:Uncharacterized protein n=1 Tax=Populus alba x Populus x berolinensis TaxID=444605 RepID=A0AAD6M946_9ROSI|nr:hypothetical protein NC653_024343 [Populus alba x Populus x berolinensis]
MPLSSKKPQYFTSFFFGEFHKDPLPKTVSKVQFFNAKNVKIIELEGKQRSLSSHGGYSVKMSWDVPPPSVKLIIHGKNLKDRQFRNIVILYGHLMQGCVLEVESWGKVQGLEDVSHGVVRAEEDAEKSNQLLIWCRQLFNKLRKIEDEESDHGRHMKGFNKLKVREPMSRVVENDADTVSQRKDDDNLDEVGPFNIFVRGSSFMLS